jgi:hypothetical protein
VVTGFLAAVADGRPGLDRALTLDRPGAREDCFEECRLAALERPNQRNAPWATGPLSLSPIIASLDIRDRAFMPVRCAIVSGKGEIGKCAF